MKHSWSRQGGSKVSKDSVEVTEAYFKKEFTEAMDRRQNLTIRKGKRFRSAFTTDQIIYLEKEFKKFPYIGTAHRKEVATALNIHERAVKIWFQNRRMKEKKDAGTKDQESDDQSARKNVGFLNDKLNNVIAIPPGNVPCYSLPPLTGSTPNVISDINMKQDVSKVDNTPVRASEPFKLNYYNDVLPVPEISTTQIPYPKHIASPVQTNPEQNYRTSAEFSIDLCKKYRNNFPTSAMHKVENTFSISAPPAPKVENNKNRTTPPNMFEYHRDVVPKVEQQSYPEDLSCRASVKQREASPPQSIDPKSPGYIPFYVNYPQPYLSAGNMLWKPVNVLPIMSTGVSAVNISSNQSGSLSVSQEQGLPRKKCNCDCHLELPQTLPVQDHHASSPLQSSQPQYVITALPFQNYPKF